MITEFGKLLRIIRINSGDSAKEMAKKLNMSPSYLSTIENGKRNIPPDMEELLIHAYKLSDKDKAKLRKAMVEYNPYEFLRDHLGYRIKLISAEWSVGRTVKVNLELQNFGFASAFNLQSGFALLDKNGMVINEILTGDPSKWHSHNPADPYSDEVLIHRVSAELPLPEQSGEYSLAFFMRNSMGEYVKTANKCESLNGHQIIANI